MLLIEAHLAAAAEAFQQLSSDDHFCRLATTTTTTTTTITITIAITTITSSLHDTSMAVGVYVCRRSF